MPNVTATPKGLVNGEVVTEFTDTTGTSSVTYTYPVQQAGIMIENSGVSDINVTVGPYVNQVVKPDKKWRVDVAFTSFSIRSDANSQEFIATSFQNGEAGELATLGPELLDSAGWTSIGWLGDFANGFSHVVGQTAPLVHALPFTGEKFYQVSLTISSTVPAVPTGFFTVTIGGSQPFDTYKGGGNTFTYSFGIQSVADGNFVVTPVSDLNGTITNISVKEIVAATNPTMKVQDSNKSNSFEARYTQAALKNIFMGIGAGKMNTNGDSNTIVGHGSMANNTSGFWNSSLGADTLASNTVGSRNIAVGRVSLQNNISGHRNVAVGTFALNRNTHGANNIAVGADSLWFNTTGNENVAVGTVALGDNTTGSRNVALGRESLAKNTSGSNNIGLGYYAMQRNTTGNYNIAIGNNALERVSQSNNIAIGVYALNWGSTITNSIAIGYQSQMFTTASVNISIGANSLYSTTTGVDNVAVGDSSLKNNTTGIRNIAIGNNAATCIPNSVVNRNVIIGHNAGTQMETGADFNVIVGSSSGVPLSTGASNILIGYDTNTPTATTSNYLNIGKTIYGDTSTQNIGIGVQLPTAHLHVKASNGATGTAPIKLTTGALLTTAESGAIEFDGTDLYITTSGGIRKKITAA